MEFELSKIDAAVVQLDWAIRLFLDHKAYIPAITLAGAAEEILGVAVGRDAAFAVLKSKFASDLEMSEKEVSQNHLNKAKNWLKHWDNRTENEKIYLELELEAVQYIVRALTNLLNHNSSQPSQGQRFSDWMSENGPDLLRKNDSRPS
jgi:hypothetical protein